MSEPFIAQIVMFAGNFAPRGWAFCDGQLLPIAQNQALFSLLGTTYGGDGRTTFGLPDLRGRLPMHPGSGPGLTNRRLGEKGGAETVTLTQAQIPVHSHKQRAGKKADSADPGGRVCAATSGNSYSGTADSDMGDTSSIGGSQAHTNVQPFQCVNFIIALQGIFPSRS